jgi:uncharacterized membrane protein
MKKSNLRAIAFGAGVLVVSHVLWIYVLRSNTYPWLFASLLQSSPFVAAFMVAYMTPHNKIRAGMLMAPLTAILSVLMNFVYASLGLPTDFPGFQGALNLLGLALVSGAVLSMVGASVGHFLCSAIQERRRQKSQENN